MNKPAITARWIRNEADRKAAANGCYFDPLVGGFVVWWIERYCRLYEGDHAGEPMILRGCHEDALDRWPIPDEFDPALALERASSYAERVAAGADVDWQYECTMRLYGWQKQSQRFGRPIRRFREGVVFVPKKNKKSPTLAAWSVYNFMGDAEPGQKVFLGAKDGEQAKKIAGAHAIAMIETSPELMAECKINRVECTVTHKPTRSVLSVMSSGNERHKQSKEGINGSLSIDEIHVVDRDFMRRISRAGISRAEPLQIEVSTAGNTPEGYGKERWDYGLKVNNGEVDDEGCFFAAYYIPESTPDEAILADPIRFSKMANPAWGHTIYEEEILGDLNKSKSDPRNWSDWKMYRGNIWQASACPWLPAGAWAACRESFGLDDLAGKYCILGLDLSRSRDFSSLVGLFPTYGESGIESARVIVETFAVEDYIRRHANMAAFEEWINENWLRVTPGQSIDLGQIYAKIVAWKKAFNVQYMAYDPYRAESITQLVSEGLRNSEGDVILDSLQIERVTVGQRSAQFEQAQDEVESAIKAGKLRHNGNKVLSWNVDNVVIRDDRIAKVHKDDYRKIDGVSALVTAWAVAMDAKFRPKVSVYEKRGARYA